MALLKKAAGHALSALCIAIITLIILEISLHVASILLSRNTNNETLQNKKNTLRILTLGDSHTYGLYYTRNQAWPAQLEKKLLSNNINAEVINLAHPGTNSTKIQKNIDRMLDDIQPDIVLMLVGVNDFWTTTFDSDKENNFNNGMEWIKKNIRIYKLIIFITKQQEAEKAVGKPVYAYEEDLILLKKNDTEAITTLQRIVNRLGIETETLNGDVYLKNNNKTISLKDIILKIQVSAESIETIGGEEVKDPAIATLIKLIRVCRENIGTNDEIFGLKNGVASFGNQQYELGASNSKDTIKDFQIIKEMTIENIGAINTSVKRHNAKLILLNYPFANSMKIIHHNAYIEEAAKKNDIPLINIQKAVNALCVPAKCPELLIPNDLHPTENGHKFIANEVYKFLQTGNQ